MRLLVSNGFPVRKKFWQRLLYHITDIFYLHIMIDWVDPPQVDSRLDVQLVVWAAEIYLKGILVHICLPCKPFWWNLPTIYDCVVTLINPWLCRCPASIGGNRAWRVVRQILSSNTNRRLTNSNKSYYLTSLPLQQNV